MNSSHSVLGEQIWGTTENCEVVGEVSGHVFLLQGLHVATTDHARREGPRCMEEQLSKHWT